MRRLNSLGARLLLAVGLVVVLALGLTLLVGTELTKRDVERTALPTLARQADLLATLQRLQLNLTHLSPKVQEEVKRQNNEIRLTSANGADPLLPSDAAARIRQGGNFNGEISVDGERYYVAARPVGHPPKALVLARPKRLSAAADKPYREALLLAGLAGLVLAAILALLLSRAVVRPVRRVVEETRTLGAQRSPRAVPVEGPTELALLAESFNTMAEQLAQARDAERSFLLSVSHELKTPLTAIRGYAEALEEDVLPADEAAATIRREADRLERLVRDLLDLARMNRSEFSVKREPVDLAAAAREITRRYQTQARSFGVSLVAEVHEPAEALADADRALQVLSNLVENALRLTPAGGTVRVVAEPGQLRVEDTGPGLGPDELARAFERFFLYSRYGGERPVGTGLGLAIVKQLTEGMGGTVDVDSVPGTLTRFVVRLPSAPAGERHAREPAFA
jgi:two-component system OmpR family sensor kinase